MSLRKSKEPPPAVERERGAGKRATGVQAAEASTPTAGRRSTVAAVGDADQGKSGRRGTLQPSAADEPEMQLTGWLLKRGEKGLVKAFKKRWFAFKR
jgi:hypothetical protein